MGDRALVFRPGLVNGPYDHTDRATYWSVRARRGGEVFVPAAPDTPFQVIDARDIGQAAAYALERGMSGVFNMVNEPTTWEEWLETSRRVTVAGSEEPPRPAYVWADDQAWVEQQASRLSDIRPRGALPMYLPAQHGWNFWRVSNQHARSAGILFRPYEETIHDTLDWRLRRGEDLEAGLTPEQEQALVTAWKKR
jgi:2'-hydroxyisoflavone reductase